VQSLNLGILAHVDAGKTSLTERLLYAVGVIDEIGSVDKGNTQTDTLALERQRGITIKSAVVSFVVNGVTVNLIDTPGHPDFIAEVERVLTVLDGAVLVVSAVEGVQAQTVVIGRALERLRIPTLIFVNKIDRRRADCLRTLESVGERLTPGIISMGFVSEAGTRSARFSAFGPEANGFAADLYEGLALHDETLLTAFTDDLRVSYRRLRIELQSQSRRALVYPVFFGSAITGAGVDDLIAELAVLLPAREGDADGPISGKVFKVERSARGEKIAFARMFSGTLRTRDQLAFGTDKVQKVTAISVFSQGSTTARSAVKAGEIAKLSGLTEIQIGDELGVHREPPGDRYFSPPTLETVVVARRITEKVALRNALDQLAEQDPLINVTQDDTRGEMSISLYGEVQKEVIRDTLATDFGLEVEFRETTTIYVECPVGRGEAVEVIGQAPNPFLATVGLLVEPASRRESEFTPASQVLGTMPLAFFKAVEDSVHQTLDQGLYGWRVTGCRVTMTHSGYYPRQSHAHARFDKTMSSTGADFRGLTPLVLMAALKKAGTAVYEPVEAFSLEIPADVYAVVAAALLRHGAAVRTSVLRGKSMTLDGEIAASQVHHLRQRLPSLSRGEAVLETSFDRYRVIRGPFPTRARSDDNPLNRKEYLLRVTRRRSSTGVDGTGP
jgi:ribosomal protection tetracycline resistance protein